MISSLSLMRTGFVKPKRSLLVAICLICFLEWVRAFLAYGRKFPTLMGSMAMCGMISFQISRWISGPQWETLWERQYELAFRAFIAAWDSGQALEIGRSQLRTDAMGTGDA